MFGASCAVRPRQEIDESADAVGVAERPSEEHDSRLSEFIRGPGSTCSLVRRASWSHLFATTVTFEGEIPFATYSVLHAGSECDDILRGEWNARRSRSRALWRSKVFWSVSMVIGPSG